MQPIKQDARIKTCLQKCIYWADCALQHDPQKYYLTPAWKKSIEYAAHAKQLYSTCGGTVCNFPELERHILERGYPVLSRRCIFDEDHDDLTMPIVTDATFVDPLEEVQLQLQESQRLVHQYKKQMFDQQDEYTTKIVTMQKEQQSRIASLQDEVNCLTSSNNTLQQEVEILLRKQSRLNDKLTKKINECQSLQQQLEHFKDTSRRAIELMTTDQQTLLLQDLGAD